MTIPEIERAEAGIEVKAAAVSNLLPPVHRQAFELPLDGVLVMAATKIRSRLLIDWTWNGSYEMANWKREPTK